MNGSRGQTWSNDEVRCLLNIWAEKNLSELLETVHKNTEVYKIFSDKMKENGFHRTLEQCRVKVKKLRSHYMRSCISSDVKDKFVWYDDLDRILNSRPKVQKTQKTPSDKDGPLSANKANAPQQNISTALQSSSKYKSDSNEQKTKEEAIAKWIVRTGLPVTTIEDEDFLLMMDTVDRRLTVPKKTKISNMIDKHYEHRKEEEEGNDRGENGKIYEESDQVSDDHTITCPIAVMECATEEDMDAVVTTAPSVKTEGLDYVIKMEESPDVDNDKDSANPSSQPRGCIGHGEDTDECADPPVMPTPGDEGTGGLHNIRHKGRYDKRSNIQRVESQLSGLGERFLAESRREFEEMMSRDREWLEEDRLHREEQHRIWQQECQATIATLTQSLHRNATPPSGLLCGPRGDRTRTGRESMSPKPQVTQVWSCEEEETQLRPEVSYGVLIPATTPPRSVSAPLAETPAPPAASQREVRRGAKRGRAPPPPVVLSVFQQGVLDALNKDIGEEEHFLLSLVPALKRLDNRKKSLVRLKFQQFLFDAEFSNE